MPRIFAVLLAALLLAGCAADPRPTPPSAPEAAPPPVGARVDYQLGGAYEPDRGVDVVVRDAAASPVPGVYSICYINAFQTQPGTLAAWLSQHPGLVLTEGGRPVTDPDWPDEALLDTSTAANRADLAGIIGQDLARCARKGFDAVELDNLDSYLRSDRRLTPDDNVALVRLLAARAQALGLAAAQKNASDVGEAGRSAGLGFVIAEECQVFDECGGYTRVFGRRVIEIEYTDNGPSAFEEACRARGSQVSVLLRDRGVVARGARGYVSRWCG